MKKSGGKQTNSKSYVLIGLVLLFVFIFILFIFRRTVMERFQEKEKRTLNDRGFARSPTVSGVAKYSKTTDDKTKTVYKVDVDGSDNDIGVGKAIKNVKNELAKSTRNCTSLNTQLNNIKNTIESKITDSNSGFRRKYNKSTTDKDAMRNTLNNQITEFNNLVTEAKTKCNTTTQTLINVRSIDNSTMLRNLTQITR